MHPEEFILYKRANSKRLASASADRSLGKSASTTSLELLIVNDSEQSESDHGAGSHFAKVQESTEQPLDSLLSHESNAERPSSRESTSRKRKESNADPLSDYFQITKRQRCVQYSNTKKQIEEDFSHKRDKSNRSEEAMVNVVSECVLYGQLLAQKLKPLDVEDRLALMNDIDNLVFKHLMNIKQRSNSSRSEHLSSTNQTHSDIRLSIDLPGPSHPSNETQESSQKNMQNSPYEVPIAVGIIKTEIKDETHL